MLKTLVKANPDGSIRLTQICSGAGLGYTMADGKTPRDGSIKYYVSEPIVDNDPKGTGPFVLAGIEVQKLLSSNARVVPLRVTGWGDCESVLAKIKAPEFPARDFPITDFGAKVGADASAAI